jgi:hypothetical protein
MKGTCTRKRRKRRKRRRRSWKSWKDRTTHLEQTTHTSCISHHTAPMACISNNRNSATIWRSRRGEAEAASRVYAG